MEFKNYIDRMTDLAIGYSPKLLLAIITLIVGFWIIGVLKRALKKALTKKAFDPSVIPFLVTVFDALLKVALLISVASIIGIATTSFIAILGAMGLAIGLALQGSLSNFAGGVLILILRPFKVGDVISAQGHIGSVKEIQIFHTILKTGDNKTIIIPNGPLANSDITNFSTETTRRVDFTFGIGYNDDIDKAKATILSVMEADSRIFKDPAPFIAVSELGDSSVNFVVRVWANSSDYWSIFFGMQENVKKAFDQEGISIPFPQRDIHIYKEN